MKQDTQTIIERVSWMRDMLRACANDETVQALPIQDRHAAVKSCLRASLSYYRRLGRQRETFAMYELCLIVERSTTVRDALKGLNERILAESANIKQAPASNTGVRSPAHQMLEDYIGGR